MVHMYRAWLIDLDGTLYHARWVKLCMMLELGLLGGRALRTIQHFRLQHERVRYLEGTSGHDPFALQIESTALSLDMEPAVVRAIVEEWMFRRPGKWLYFFRRRDLLKNIVEFREAGGKTALVSDYPALPKLAALRARKLFDVVVACGEPGGPSRLKPDPEAYLLAAERLGARPSECLVLGDRKDADGEAAARAGMDFRWII